MMKKNNPISIVMLGATGAVGGETLKSLLANKSFDILTLLGRRPIENILSSNVHQHKVNIFDSSSYSELVKGHSIAICTLGVGEPSKMSNKDFIKIDKTAVLDFAIKCKDADIKHFQLLSSVGINSSSSNLFLRTKGELADELEKLNFERLSIFQPSMILTPTNRYGFAQALTLLIWPLLKPLLRGSAKKYRGISVEVLGDAFAKNINTEKQGVEMLTWEDFYSIV